MVNICKGCGLEIQNWAPGSPGYSPKEKSVLCQSCYRLFHYGDVSKVTQVKVKSEEVLSQLRHYEALFVWVVDLFHLNESMVSGVRRHLANKDIVLVGTKRELLPTTVSKTKITDAVNSFLDEANIQVKGMAFVAHKGRDGKEELIDLLKHFNKYQKIVFFGTTNVGKSTLINTLSLNETLISTSYLPGTTLEMIEVKTGYATLIDSPGIQESTPLIEHLSSKALSLLQPQKPIKPTTYQLNKDQALIIGGLGYVSFIEASELTVTCYLPSGINLHRTKLEKAQTTLQQFRNDLLTIKNSEIRSQSIKQIKPKFDIVLHDVGFICIQGEVKQLMTHFPKEVVISTRKAYI